MNMLTKTNKFIILFTLISILCCLLYLPWKAEHKYSYGNVISYQVGYAFLGHKPTVYIEADINLIPYDKNNPFNDIPNVNKLNRDVLVEQGYTIYPDWVKSMLHINYIQVLINILMVLLFWSIVGVIYNLFLKKR